MGAKMDPNFLASHTISELVRSKGRLVEVPYTASVGDALETLHTKNILAVPVAAPPGEWIGAGGTMVVERDPSTGIARKQFIGMVSIMDLLVHLTEGMDGSSGDLTTPVSSVIGHSMEGLSLWTMSPSATLLEAMEPLGKGVHRMLVPVVDPSVALEETELEATDLASSYKMLTQTDVIHFFLENSEALRDLLSMSLDSLGLLHQSVFAVPEDMPITQALKCMKLGGVSAVAVVPRGEESKGSPTLIEGRGREVLATLSASDLRGSGHKGTLADLPYLTVQQFLRKVAVAERFGYSSSFGARTHHVDKEGDQLPAIVADPASSVEKMLGAAPKKPVTCPPDTSLGNVMASALSSGVHRVWITDTNLRLLGVVAFSDIIKGVRKFFSGSAGRL